MTKSELIKRYTLFIISLFFSALGVAFTKHGELGGITDLLHCQCHPQFRGSLCKSRLRHYLYKLFQYENYF